MVQSTEVLDVERVQDTAFCCRKFQLLLIGFFPAARLQNRHDVHVALPQPLHHGMFGGIFISVETNSAHRCLDAAISFASRSSTRASWASS